LFPTRLKGVSPFKLQFISLLQNIAFKKKGLNSLSIIEQLGMAIALAMDAFAVAICKGLTVKKIKPRHLLITGLYFGGFQALMPLIGYFLGVNFRQYIESVDHWIAFALLGIIGANMIRESFSKDEENHTDDFSFKSMLPLAVATSIDALAVGVTLAFLKVNVVSSVSLIGVITFMISAAGVLLGRTVGCKFKSKAEFFGGAILILMGLKILLEHSGIISF